jgi:glycogen operon protein
MSEEDWATGFAKSLALFLNGEEIAHASPRGEHVRDDSFY